PLELALSRAQGDARLQLWLHAEAAPGEARASIDARVLRQTLVPLAHVDRALHVDVAARFDAQRGQSDIVLSRLSVADDAAVLGARVTLFDAGDVAPLVRHAEGKVDLTRLLRVMPPGLAPFQIDRGKIRYALDRLEIGALPCLERGGWIAAEGELFRVRP